MKVIPFGKYKGRLWADVARSDPYYLDWVICNTLNLDWKRSAQQALSAVYDSPRSGGQRLTHA